MATIRTRRRIVAANTPPGAAPTTGGGTAGELRYASNGYSTGVAPFDPQMPVELIIDDGVVNRDLISARRQVEINGNQAIAGIKTFGGASAAAFATTANMTFGNGTAGEVLTKGAGTTVQWSAVTPFTGVFSDDSLDGDGIQGGGNPLGIANTVWGAGLNYAAFVASVDFATAAEVATGTEPAAVVSPSNLLGALGLPVAQLGTAARTVVPAINELLGLIGAAGGGLVFSGTYDVQTGQVVGVGPGSDGNLPAAGAGNNGWFVIAINEGQGQPPAPNEQINRGDWLISGEVPGSGGQYRWYRAALGIGVILAANVTVTPAVAGQTNVQAALTQLNTIKLETVNTDTSLTGLGTALSALSVDIVDGGTF